MTQVTQERPVQAAALPAVTALRALPVKGRASKTGYSRTKFGPAWSDTDRNGCDTRNDVLRRDLRPVVVAVNGCTVLSGSLTDPYSGAKISLARSGTIQIDHVVALADAWVKGGQRLTAPRRTQFANDPINLITTTAAMNTRKGAGDAATWLPPRKAFRCTYVARQIAVKRTYGLWVTRAEHDAMARVLATCPKQTLPTAASTTTPRITPRPTTRPTPTSAPTGTDPTSTPSTTPSTTAPSTTAPTTTPTAAPTTPTPTSTPLDPRFPTCKAAKAAGYGPYYRGVDPEYYWYRDADSDGIVCE
jgi:hypothetical protein